MLAFGLVREVVSKRFCIFCVRSILEVNRNLESVQSLWHGGSRSSV